MKKPSKGYVYVASVVSNPNLCKIGYTKGRPEVRVKRLKRDYPGFEFELYESFELEKPKMRESMAHDLLHPVRFDREMFSVTPVEGCIAVRRTIGKRFSVNNASNFDFSVGIKRKDKSGNEYLAITPEIDIAHSFNYVRVNLGLDFVNDWDFDLFKCVLNTYMEKHNATSSYDITASKFIDIAMEATL